MVGTWRSTSTLHKISSVLFTVFLTVIRDWICHGLLRSFLAPLPSCIIFLCTSGLNFSFMTLFKPVLYCFCCCARLGHKNCINLHLLCKDLAHQLLAVLRASPDSPSVCRKVVRSERKLFIRDAAFSPYDWKIRKQSKKPTVSLSTDIHG